MRPLVVDLDGTLIKTDLLIESFLLLLRKNLLYLFLAPIWLLRGKAYFKAEIARRVDIDIKLLPYNQEFLAYLREQHANGRELWLATASNVKYADAVALHIDLFSKVLSSSAQVNLSGAKKKTVLVQLCGEKGFDYAGNAVIDVAVWKSAANAIVVNAASSVVVKAGNVTDVQAVYPKDGNITKSVVKSLRLHQWVKNTLVFVPLAVSHQYHDWTSWQQGFLAFLAFSLCASCVYIVNDLMDLPEDRQHRTKRFRSFASGALSPLVGMVMAPLLLVGAALLATKLPYQFAIVLTTYFIITCAYSFYLKRKVLVDVITLAGLYTVRIIAGTVALSLQLSFWLLAFSMFVFLSLAIIKRYSELLELKNRNDGSSGSSGSRGYLIQDLELLASLGGSSGYIAVLVLALYVHSQEIAGLYSHPQFLWLCCPLFLFWISRAWVLTHRGLMHDDPIVWAIKDRGSYAVGILMAMAAWLAV